MTARLAQGSLALLLLLAFTPVSSFADLRYVTFQQPCRIIDTRPAREPLEHGKPRNFNVAGTTGFEEQGGNPEGCGVPTNAVAAAINFVAVNAQGAGNLRASAYPTEVPATGSIINYQGLSPALNIANGLQFPICDASVNECNFGITVQANGAATDLVADVLGYFLRGVVSEVAPGTGLTGGGTGPVVIGIAPGGVGQNQLAASAVTTGAIQDGAVTGPKIATRSVVREINRVTDSVTIAAAGGASVSTAGSTITVSAPITPRGSVIHGPPGDTTIIGAGYAEGGSSGLQMWRPMSASGAPAARHNHTAVWTGSRMIVWGGNLPFQSVFENTGGMYDPVTDTWTATSTTNAPVGRYDHTAVWTGSLMIVWGGHTGASFTDSGGKFDPASNSWSPTSTFGAPAARSRHTAVWATSAGTMIIWGGYNATFLNSGSQYNPSGDGAWAATNLTGAPNGRTRHTAVWTGAPENRMIVWGGDNGSLPDATGAVYNPAAAGGGAWSGTNTTNVPAARMGHDAVWTGTQMIVWGGWGGDDETVLNTGGRYTPSSNSWSATNMTGAPSARMEHTAVWTGSTMIVWGGEGDGPGPLNSAFYDPASDSWSAITTAGAPAHRRFHTAVWTGSRMLIWGGSNEAGSDTSGAQWFPLSYYIKN